jgi:SAM-dependent methyltransferase
MKNVNCNICGENNTELLFKTSDLRHKTTEQIFSVVRCNNCALVYLNPQPEKNEIQDFYPDEYPPHQKEREPLIKKSKWLSTLFKILKPKKRKWAKNDETKTVLDIGCGSGKKLEELRQRNSNWTFFGLDTDTRAVKIATEKGFNIFEGELMEAKYADASFDLIFMEHVLEHVPDPALLLNETRRILKSDGILFITVPNFRSWERILFGQYWRPLEMPRHLYNFTPATLKKLLQKCGFEITNLSFHSSPKYFLESISLWRHGEVKKGYSPLSWILLLPFTKLFSLFGLTSTMKCEAEK